MKDFFRNLMNNLKLQTGLNQLQKIKDECNSQDEFNERFDILLNALTKEANRFSKIPDDMKQASITSAMLRDDKLYEVTPKWIYKVLTANYTANRSKYESLAAEKEKPKEAEPAPAEVALKYISEFKKQLDKVGKPEKSNTITILDSEAKEIWEGTEKEIDFLEFMKRLGYKKKGEVWEKFKGSGTKLRERFKS